MVTNANLQSARTARDDESIRDTRSVDANLVPLHARPEGCRVYCGADGPESMFVRWMLDHWDALELSGLTATRFNPSAPCSDAERATTGRGLTESRSKRFVRR